MDRFPCFRVASLLVLLCFLLSWQASAFLIKPSVSTILDSFSTKEKIDNVPYKQSFFKGTSIQAAANDHFREELDIVLFGVGDLRVDDHEGLPIGIHFMAEANKDDLLIDVGFAYENTRDNVSIYS